MSADPGNEFQETGKFHCVSPAYPCDWGDAPARCLFPEKIGTLLEILPTVEPKHVFHPSGPNIERWRVDRSKA